ncbi:MAG: PKD domain-containing protein [Vicinamibacteraceae bacterium]
MTVTALSRSARAALWLACPAVLATACGLEPTSPPPVTGPSELGLALRVTASPDILPRDGVSTARLLVEARNARSAPVDGLSLWAETLFRGAIADVGLLSSKTAATDASGRAYLTYTAPPSAEADNTDEGNHIVTIRITPIGDDYAGAASRVAHIRLVPVGVVLPPAGNPHADFTVSPATPEAGDLVQLDASASRDCPADTTLPADCTSAATLETFEWLFGDGARGTGTQVTHRYPKAGEYVVTLSVTNDRGRSASVSKEVEVGEPEG